MNTKFNPIRPIYLMNTPDIRQEEKEAAVEALREVLDIGRVGKQIPIRDFGVWRNPGHIDENGGLRPHMSVDWYVDKWFNPKRNQVNTNSAMIQMLNDPWNKREPHYDVILTAYDLYAPETNFVLGVATGQRGTIASMRRFRQIKEPGMERETKKQEIYHEIAHVFEIPDEKRGFALEYSLGTHCANSCAVKQGLRVPHDWIMFVHERKKTRQIYCDPCVRDLRKYFGTE